MNIVENVEKRLSHYLCQEVPNNCRREQFPSRCDKKSLFFSCEEPSIGFDSFVQRLKLYIQVSESAFVVSLVYMKRLGDQDEVMKPSRFNVHRLFLTALVLAAKMLEDQVHRNGFFAKVGGIPSVKEMNHLEIIMLNLLDFRLFVSPLEYEDMERKISIFPSSPGRPTQMIISSIDCHDEMCIFHAFKNPIEPFAVS